MTEYLDGLRTDRGVSFLDKLNALLLALRGTIHMRLGEESAAAQCPRRAHRIASEFDVDPNYTCQNIRYCSSTVLRAQ